MKQTLLAVAMLFVLGSCASKKKLLSAQKQANEIQIQLDKARADLNDCDSRTAGLNNDLKAKTATWVYAKYATNRLPLVIENAFVPRCSCKPNHI